MKASIASFFLLCAAALAAPDASEWAKPRLFHEAFDLKFDDQIKVDSKEKTEAPKSAIFSDNDAYWFHVEPYDETEWVQRIVISGEDVIAITLDDAYPNFPVRVHWINEKLIFIRVWWGRIVGTDIIFDVEKQVYLSLEMVVDGTQLYNQTRQALEKADQGGVRQ
jgi:hypothetical protein